MITLPSCISFLLYDLFPASWKPVYSDIFNGNTLACFQHDPGSFVMDSFCFYFMTFVQKDSPRLYGISVSSDGTLSLFKFFTMEDAFVFIRHPGFPPIDAVASDLGAFFSGTIPDVCINSIIELF